MLSDGSLKNKHSAKGGVNIQRNLLRQAAGLAVEKTAEVFDSDPALAKFST